MYKTYTGTYGALILFHFCKCIQSVQIFRIAAQKHTQTHTHTHNNIARLETISCGVFCLAAHLDFAFSLPGMMKYGGYLSHSPGCHFLFSWRKRILAYVAQEVRANISFCSACGGGRRVLLGYIYLYIYTVETACAPLPLPTRRRIPPTSVDGGRRPYTQSGKHRRVAPQEGDVCSIISCTCTYTNICVFVYIGVVYMRSD